MKKTITLITLMTGIILLYSLPTNALYTNFANVVASVGETMDEIGINYHTNLTDSYIIYGLDPELKDGSKAYPKVSVWSRDEGDYPAFEKRFVCKVNLTKLELYKTYYYQIHSGTNHSRIFSFSTGHSQDTTTFAWLTDSQTFINRYNDVESVLNNIKKSNPVLDFCLLTGDITDRGGQEEHWNCFFKQVENLESMAFATIPGNHEYYLTAAGTYVSPEVYNQYFNNPQNGCEERLNSSYYFKYNNILFIMLDAIKAEYVDEQRAWLIDVLDNNTADFIIVGTHAGLITCGNYSHDANRMITSFRDIFENYSVDLAISGHEHVFAVQKTRLNGEVNEELGTTYVIGPAAGNKTYPPSSYGMDYVKEMNYGGCVISANSKELTLTLYDQTGKELYDLTLPNRRFVNNDYDEEVFLKSLLIERDETKETAKLVWDSDIYGFIDEIKISGVEKNEYVERNLKDITRKIKLSNINSVDLGANYSDTNYHYVVTITKTDGSSVTKEFDIINNKSLVIVEYTVTFKDFEGNILSEQTVIEGENATPPDAPILDGYTFIGWDQGFDNVTSDLVINPIYEEIIQSGCKKDLLLLVSSNISILCLGLVLLRKKDN